VAGHSSAAAVCAADEVLYSLGITKETLRTWLDGSGTYFVPEDFVDVKPGDLPLLNGINSKSKHI
jgi:hypothetical protein